MLDWNARAPRLLDEILSYDADIICLQEVEKPFYEDHLEPFLREQGYASHYYGRRRKPTDPVSGPEEGPTLSYRVPRFTLTRPPRLLRFGDYVAHLTSHPFWRQVSEREDGGILALLQDGGDGMILAGSVHLFWDPRFPDVKAGQAHILCAEVDEILRKTVGESNDALILIGGDFNSLPYKTKSDAFDTLRARADGTESPIVSGVYTLLSTGKLPTDHPDHPATRRGKRDEGHRVKEFTSCGLGLRSAAAAAWEIDPPLTTKIPSFSGCLDYVWMSRNNWTVASALEMPYKFDEKKMSGGDDFPPIPNEDYPSDHLAMAFQLYYS